LHLIVEPRPSEGFLILTRLFMMLAAMVGIAAVVLYANGVI